MGWPAASDEMCAVPGLQRRRTLEPIVAVTEIGFSPGAGVPDLDVRWIHGSAAAKYNTDPDIQVHACDEHTYILRQNKAVHYEAPFMFLLFGSSRALLLDTGATAALRDFDSRRITAYRSVRPSDSKNTRAGSSHASAAARSGGTGAVRC